MTISKSKTGNQKYQINYFPVKENVKIKVQNAKSRKSARRASAILIFYFLFTMKATGAI